MTARLPRHSRELDRNGILFALVLVLVLAGLPGVAGGHPGPSIWGDLRLQESEILFTIEGAAGPLTTNLGLDVLLLGPLSDEKRAKVFADIQAEFQNGYAVEVDGVRVIPTLQDLMIQDGPEEDQSWRSARFVLRYPITAPPRSVGLTWDSFEGEGVQFIPVTIQFASKTRPPKALSLWPDEPQYTWHADDVRPRRVHEVVRLASRSSRPTLPLPSVLLVASAACWLIGFLRSGRRHPVAAAAGVILLLAGAAFAWDEGRVPLPGFGREVVALPAPSQALEIFETLHRNIYAAFDAGTEDQIYDLLSTSVDAALLDELYGDVYESLILREEGGAVCGIDKVEVDERKLDESVYEEGGEPIFYVDWAWRVFGVVSHWGHVHQRINKYRARYTVRNDGEAWKISAVQVDEHERIDDR